MVALIGHCTDRPALVLTIGRATIAQHLAAPLFGAASAKRPTVRHSASAADELAKSWPNNCWLLAAV